MSSSTTMLRLEEIRKRRGVSLEQISDKTKISTRFLRAIETEEFEKLPGGVFNTNYIRQYAAAIDFAEEKLLEQYTAFEQSRQQAEANIQAECEARRGRVVSLEKLVTNLLARCSRRVLESHRSRRRLPPRLKACCVRLIRSRIEGLPL